MFAAVGVVTYLFALLVTIPAALVVPTLPGLAGVGGTIWSGHALVGGGSRLEWQWAPLRSIANFALAADWQVAGERTDLGGRALLRPGGVRLDAVAGRADGALLRTVAPALPFTCDLAMQVDLANVVIGGGEQGVAGEVRSDPGACRQRGTATATPVPALVMTADRDFARGTVATLTPAAQRRRQLAEATLDPAGRLRITVTPVGATTLPFAAPPGGLTIETEL